MRPWLRTIRRRANEPYGPTHAGKLERWLGAENVANLSQQFRGWYGPPIAVGGVPGNVYITAGGEFVGPITVGHELTHQDLAEVILRRRAKLRAIRRNHLMGQAGAFGSLSALIAAYSGGKNCLIHYSKVGVTANAVANSNELWTRGNQPAAGAAGAAAPGGTATSNATAGQWGYVNAVANANTGHFIGGSVAGGTVANTLLIVDQLLRVAKTMNSTATEAVTGTFSRYQSQTATDPNYIGGNFCFPAVPTTVLPATAHNWTVCQYTSQGGTAGQSFPSATGVSACVVGGIDLAAGTGSWFLPLAAADVGVKALTQMQCSALVATGTIDFVVAHPICTLPVPVANQVCLIDAISTAVDMLNAVYDNACITGLELHKPATTAVTYTGYLKFCSE